MKKPPFVHPKGERRGSVGHGETKKPASLSFEGRFLARVDRSPDSRLPRSPSRDVPSGIVERAKTETRSGLSQWRGRAGFAPASEMPHPRLVSFYVKIIVRGSSHTRKRVRQFLVPRLSDPKPGHAMQ